MVKVRWTDLAVVVRRFGDFLVIWRGVIIKTYSEREKAKGYARGWNSVEKDRGKFRSSPTKKRGGSDDE